MRPAEFILATILIVWFAASVANQLPGSRRTLALYRYDPAGLIPAWTFFAPRPGVTDFAVLYRDACGDDDYTPWRRLSSGARRDPWTALWHPEKRFEKLVTDLVPGLASAYGDGNRQHLVSVPYLTLLAAVVGAEHDCRATRTQMAIAAIKDRHGSGEPGVVFVSALVPLDAVE